MEFKYSKNIKYLILALGGIILMVLSFLIHMVNPVEGIINKLMTMSENSFLLNIWSKPPYEVLIKTFIFNVTNQEAFLNGTEKLRFEEVGPYVYQEILVNANPHFNDNGTITATQIRNLLPRPDLSKGNLNDKIISPNIPLLAISSVLSKFGWFLNLAPSKVIDNMNVKEFANINVSEYLWGYKDPLVTIANTFMPGWIDFSKFGIFDRLFAVDNASNVVTIYLSENTSVQVENNLEIIAKRPSYSVHRFNGSPGLKQWGYRNDVSETKSKCNTIEGAFDGGLFPRNLKENVTLHFYRKAFCRAVPMNYESKGYNKDGYEMFIYGVDRKFLARKEENPENGCYCTTKNCLPNGFGDLSPCYYTFPITISLPHYLNADPKVAEQVEGLHPDKEKHQPILKLNPQLGIPLAATLRIQININTADTLYTKKSQPFKGMMIPLFWLELEIRDVPDSLKFYVSFALHNGYILQEVLKWSIGLLGISMVAAAALIIFFFPPERQLEDPYGNRIGYSPILVLPISNHFKPTLRISK